MRLNVVLAASLLWPLSVAVGAQPALTSAPTLRLPTPTSSPDGAPGVPALLADSSDATAPVGSGHAYEVLTGSRAFQHLSDKRLRHPERFLTLSAALMAHSYRPTSTIVVLRSLGEAELSRPSTQAPTPLLATATFSNSQGEIIFWSWDDGDDSTWEGSQYVERYSDGAWVTYDGQLDVSNTDGRAIWSQKTGGGGGIGPENQVRRPPANPFDAIRPAIDCRDGRAGQPRPAQNEEQPGGSGPPAPETQDQLDPEFKQWAVCITSGCLGCAGGCLFTGPLYPECYGACCFGVAIACAIQYYFS